MQNLFFLQIKLQNHHILFTRLSPKISNDIPGEAIKLCKFKVATAKEDGMYNVVSILVLMVIHLIKLNNIINGRKLQRQLEEKGLSENKIDYQRQKLVYFTG